MLLGIAADHGGFALKEELITMLQGIEVDVMDFGAYHLDPEDDYPDFIIPLARSVASGEVDRGVALCGTGVGASVAANKVAGARAALIHDVVSTHQGVESDDMNILCLGADVIKALPAWELTQVFLAAHFCDALEHCRRLAKIHALEPVSLTLSVSLETFHSVNREAALLINRNNELSAPVRYRQLA